MLRVVFEFYLLVNRIYIQRAMTVDTSAALQELHGRLTEIEELVNGSTERGVTGAMTRLASNSWSTEQDH